MGMTLEEGHAILNRVRDGEQLHATLIRRALFATGDLGQFRVRQHALPEGGRSSSGWSAGPRVMRAERRDLGREH
jgi:hypothetical protein